MIISKEEKGFTLIEIMASIVILSVVSLTLTTFFVQALSYAKGNQNKTIMVNLARNTLFYIQKEPFLTMKNYFEDGNVILDSNNCKNAVNCSYAAARDPESLAAVLNPTVNGIQYYVSIEYEQELLDQMKNTPPSSSSGLPTPSKVADYFLPVKVVVKSTTTDPSKREQTEVEGYIIDESIR